MVKDDIIKKIALLSKDRPKDEIVTQKQTKYVLEMLSDIIAEELNVLALKAKNNVELKGNDKITLQGIGTFSVSKLEPRNGKHPRTGEPMRYGESYRVHFGASQKLKDAVV